MPYPFVKQPIVAMSLGDVVWLAFNFYGAKGIKRCIRVRGIWYAWTF